MIIGADLALNHGALVAETGQIIYKYSKGQGNDSSIEYLYQRALEARSAIHRGIYSVAIDWDRNSGSWGRGKKGATPKTALLMTVLIFQFTTLCRAWDQAEIHLVSPSMIRRCLDLPARCSKEMVHNHCMENSLLPVSVYPLKSGTAELRGDIIDAYLLASTLSCSSNYVDRKANF